jgi:diguanylate cyclase (GGDEF)-like protein
MRVLPGLEGFVMRRILELCVEADGIARDVYVGFAAACPDPGLARTFTELSRQEDEHIGWWLTLVELWDRGLLPDVFPQTDAVHADMLELVGDVRALTARDPAAMTPGEMLETAAKLEFFLLEPSFGDIIELSGPATAADHREAYSEHVERLVTAIEHHRSSSPEGESSSFLARVLRRQWHATRGRAEASGSRDRLTGMISRASLLEHLEPWAAWSSRYGRAYGLMLVDIDRLGDINSDHGFAVGDRILTEVGEAVMASTRASDLVARYGGDEFIVLMPEADADDVRRAAQRLLVIVHTLALPSGSVARLPVSVSIGGAVVCDAVNAMPRPISEVLAAADHALHEAKSAGRDRVAEPLVLAV